MLKCFSNHANSSLHHDTENNNLLNKNKSTNYAAISLTNHNSAERALALNETEITQQPQITKKTISCLSNTLLAITIAALSGVLILTVMQNRGIEMSQLSIDIQKGLLLSGVVAFIAFCALYSISLKNTKPKEIETSQA